ncbi:MAG: hypothetical protein PUC36_06065, partial [Clostridiales bacterium]|nr:hypothetical protein [Clostridiales bacterium]
MELLFPAGAGWRGSGSRRAVPSHRRFPAGGAGVRHWGKQKGAGEYARPQLLLYFDLTHLKGLDGIPHLDIGILLDAD